MELNKLMVNSRSAWIDFPELEGFSVEVVNLARKELTAMSKRCTTTKFNRSSRTKEETLDNEKFIEEFSDATIKNWKGLSLVHLEKLVLIDTKGQAVDAELEYSQSNAAELVKSSTEFDNWLNEVVFDLDNFRSTRKGRSIPKAD